MSAVPFGKVAESKTEINFLCQLGNLFYNHAENTVGLLTEKIEPNHPPRFATNEQIIENVVSIISLMQQNNLSSRESNSWKTPYFDRGEMQDVIRRDLTTLADYNDPSSSELTKIKDIMTAIKPIPLALRSEFN